MNKCRITAIALMATASAAALAVAAVKPASAKPAPAATVPVDPAYMWDLSDLYASPEAWTVEHDRVEAVTDTLDKYKDTLGKSAKDMLTAFDALSAVQKADSRLTVYAKLKADEDVRVAVNQERQQLATSLTTQFSEKTSWVTPEILSVGAEKVHAFEKDEPELARRFGFYLDNVLRNAPHTLSAETEGVLAAAGDILVQPNAIYSVLANAELPFPSVTLSDGSKVTIDQGSYSKYRQSANRADRKKVFETFWGMWKGTVTVTRLAWYGRAV